MDDSSMGDGSMDDGSVAGGPPTTREGTGDIGAWSEAWRAEPDLEASFEAMVQQLRAVQDLVGGARPTVAATGRVSELLAEAGDLLVPFQVGESEQLAGKQHHLAGRSQSLVPVVSYDRQEADLVAGWVTFGRYYLGGGGAVHGGAVPLVFDELLGRLAGAGGRPRSRTAYLHVNYRKVIPIGRPVRFTASVGDVEGRKIMTAGALTEDDTVLADAEGLFVALRPGQP